MFYFVKIFFHLNSKSNVSKTCLAYNNDRSTLSSELNYEWLNYNNIGFWSIAKELYLNNNYVYYPNANTFRTHSHGAYGQPYDYYAVRPVVNFKKTAIGNKNTYEIGEKIIFNNEEYYVLENSDNTKNYVVALKYKPLSTSQLDDYEYNGSRPFVQYYASDNCNYSDKSGCTVIYEESNVKKIIDAWASNNFDDGDLITRKGYNARLLTVDELIDKLGYIIKSGSSSTILKSEDTPSWVYNTQGYYWIMPFYGEYAGQSTARKVLGNVIYSNSYDSGLVRPVVNLKKCALGDTQCKYCPNGIATYKNVTYYSKYNFGDKIVYKGEEYYILKDVDDDKHYVTLLKRFSLNQSELNIYGKDDNGDTFINKYSPAGNGYWDSQKVAYYTSETCKKLNNSIDSSGCTNNFNNSDVKKVLDNWASDKLDLDELVEVDGYKYRILNEDDITILGYEKGSNCSTGDSCYITNTPSDLLKYNTSNVWTMIKGNDNKTVYAYIDDTKQIVEMLAYNNNGINPVLNVNKCIFEDGCTEDKVLVSCEEIVEDDEEIIPTPKPDKDPENPDNSEDPENQTPLIVEVANTLSIISKIAIIIGVILVIGGLSIIGYTNYKKNGSK